MEKRLKQIIMQKKFTIIKLKKLRKYTVMEKKKKEKKGNRQ